MTSEWDQAWRGRLERVNERAPLRDRGEYLTVELAAANELLGAGCEDVVAVELGVSPIHQCCRERGLRVSSVQLDNMEAERVDGVVCINLIQYALDPRAVVSALRNLATRVLVVSVPGDNHDALAVHRFDRPEEFIEVVGLGDHGEVLIGTVEEAAGRSFLARVNL